MNKLFIFVLLLFSSCVIPVEKEQKIIHRVENIPFEVIVIDGCEYLFRSESYRSYLTHKGNCKYCNQRKNEKLN